MKTFEGVYVETHVFLSSALVGNEWSASRPGRLTPEEKAPSTHWAPEPVWTRWRGEQPCPYRDSKSDTSAVQPVASRYTDCTIPGHP
jgi:hypothetical protein